MRNSLKAGDVITTIIKCAGGENITLTHSVSMPRPYSRNGRVQGTKGIWLEDVKNTEGGVPDVKADFNPYRAKKVEFRHMSREEQDKLIEEDPRYGRIICRCEQITEGEILDAIHSSVVPTSVDAIKRRTRAGMGRCQGGFCQPKVLEILARELGKDWTEIHLKDAGSQILFEETRQGAKKGGDK